MSSTSPANEPRQIGLFTLVCLVVANMIGSAVYTSSGFALGSLGTAPRVLSVWLAGGVIATCGAIAYGALASRIPLSGGEYLYLSRLAHPAIGFVAGWISLVAGFTAPIAFAGKVLGVYASQLDSHQSHWPNILATIAITLGAAIHASYLRWGALLQNISVMLKMVCLAFIVFIALVWPPSSGWNTGQLTSLPIPIDASWMQLIPAMLSSLVWISLAYSGFNAAIYVAGESAQGHRTVPNAMWIATLLVTLFYFALNAIFLYAPVPESIAGKEQIATLAMSALGGYGFETFVRWTIILSSGTSLLSMLMAGPRVYAKMAEDGVMPKFFQFQGELPRIAILVQASLSIIVVWSSNLERLIGYLGLTLSACAAMAIACVWRIKKVYPEAKSLRWWEHAAAASFIISTLILLWVAKDFKEQEFWACMATFALGGLIYALTRIGSWGRRGGKKSRK